MSVPEQALEALLREHRRFPPSAAFRASANAADPAIYARAAADPEAFWAECGAALHWFRPWDRVLDWDPPHAQWFVGGQLNAAYNCLDRHLGGPRRNKAALIWEGEPGDTRVYTYWDLHREVSRFANVLKHLGVAKGDRVAIYLPMIPEAIITMLACARIGAPHSVVFGGFSADSLRDRINDAGAKVLVTADGGYRRGRVVALKEAADHALRETPEHRARGGGPAGRGTARAHAPARGPRPLVRGPDGAGVGALRGRADGRGGPALSSFTPPARPASRKAWCTPRAGT